MLGHSAVTEVPMREELTRAYVTTLRPLSHSHARPYLGGRIRRELP